ncbi:MAG: hypothetical protein KME36_13200 [Candidatus Thiodiazotropha sp. (ex Lucina pensylvanica)]|nr:hypothetical protein [Candidatus Thiodiazotropha sp. (ex Lucina pensylvanica)]MBT3051182.1 hypothetical protein [Candidatus Thiodiazotropha sp. (ex Codakia orbicularis)]
MPEIKIENLNIGKALLFAPLVAPIIYFIGVLLFTDTGAQNVRVLMRSFFFVSAFALPVAYVSVIIIGLPTIAILNSKGALSTRNIVMIGAGAGAVLFTAFIWLMSGFGPFVFEPPQVFMFLGAGALQGLVVSFVFAWIAGITSTS